MSSPAIRGTNGPDSITGTAGNDKLSGRNGDDRLYGGAGNDDLSGGGDDDSLFGGAGDDLLDGGDGRNSLYGGDGADVAYLDVGSRRGSVLEGGTGQDYLSVGASSGDEPDEAIVLDLGLAAATLRVGGDDVATISGFETLEVVAGDGDDRITAVGGGDFLFVAGGENQVAAGAGDDTVGYTLGEVNDLDGGSGFDILFVTAGEEDRGIVFNGARGDDSVGSSITGFEAFNVFGAEVADTISAGRNDDMVAANGGDDNVRGLAGDDTIFGAAGRDTLRGDEGADEIWGGDGGDQLYGGAGADSFWFSSIDRGVDRIRDFEDGVDTLMLDAAITGGALSAGELDPSRFRADAPVGTQGQFVLLDTGANDKLVWDANGTAAGGVTEIAVLSGESGLTAGDIVLF